MDITKLLDTLFKSVPRDGMQCIELTECKKYGNQDVVIVIGMGKSALDIKKAYDNIKGSTVLELEV